MAIAPPLFNDVTGSGPNPGPVHMLLAVFDEPIYLEPAQPNDGDVD